MDDLVMQAIKKWPNVPTCYGWLGLDKRGQWFLRDDAVQTAGPFSLSKGDRLEHAQLLAFIARNYEGEASGQWFFQNGPQRVYVELESTPWIWRLQADGSLHTHTGLSAVAEECLTDAEGHVYFSSNRGLGLVHSADVGLVADGVERGKWVPEAVRWDELPARYGFVRSPQASRSDR